MFAYEYPRGHMSPYGAAHGYEVAFVFQHWGGWDWEPSAAELALSDVVGGYWTRFAADGDPNGAGAPTWEPWSVAPDTYLTLDSTVTTGAALRREQCAFWAGEL